MTTMSASTVPSDPAGLAALIHDDVLQSLGVAVLGVDLCRRFHQRERYEQALEEIVGISDALNLALASSARLLPSLMALLPPSRPTGRRMALTGSPDAARPAAGPQEIVDTLAACATQARRCRGQYDAGLGEDTMQDLEVMNQRLEFASVAFRDVMGQLRLLAGRPLAPQSASPRTNVVAWSRSA